jgi:hypothetical protein
MRALVPIVLGVVGVGTLALTIAARVTFPWPLEWMEGATLQHASRLVAGRALYAPPDGTWIAYLYPPLAYVPMALSAKAFGATLPAARVPSVLALAATLVCIARIAARDFGRRDGRARQVLAGSLAAGMFAVGYGYTGAFLDLARVDAMFVLLLVAGAERLHAERPLAALALFVASAFAKQHGVWFLVAASAWLVACDARRHAPRVAAAWLGAALLYGTLSLATGGWFHTYVLLLPSSHPIEARLLASFPFVDLGVYLPVLVVSAALALRDPAARRGPLLPLVIAGLVAGALGRAHPGGHDNVRLPAFAMLVVFATPSLARAMLSSASRRVGVIAACAAGLQFALLWQPPRAHRPPAGSAAGFSALTRALTRCANGGTIATLDYVLPAMAPAAHTMALSDLMLATDGLDRAGITAARKWLGAPDAPDALAIGESFAALDRVTATHYRECARVPAPPLATGYVPGRSDGGALWQVVHARR